MTIKISEANIDTATLAAIVVPKISNIQYSGDDTATNPAGGELITINGSGFTSGSSVLINGAAVGVVSFVSSTQLTFISPANTAGSYVIYVISNDGGTAISIPGIQYSGTPTWSTAAGSLGSTPSSTAVNITLAATGDAPVTYSVFSGTLPPGVTLNSSTGFLSGTTPTVTVETTYSFVIRATDLQNQDTNRSFSLTVALPTSKLWTWGWNSYGRLGLGDQVNKSSPVQVGSLVDWKKLATGAAFSLAIKGDGSIWSWGRNDSGQLGLGPGDRTNRFSPNQIGTMTNWLTVAAGGYFCAAIKTDGTIWTWGSNSNGQLGLGTSGSYLASPNQVGTLTNWAYTATSGNSVLALKTDGTIWTWGQNSYGQLGLGNGSSYSSPKQVGTLTNWQKIYSNDRQAGAIKTDGTLWTWGRNAYGIGGLGTSAQYTPTFSPAQVGTLTNWDRLAIGGLHMQATKTDGTLWAWGKNTVGQLGLGNTNNMSSPTQVGALTTWSTVASGMYFTLAIKTTGTLWSWGRNSYSELGLNNTTGYSSPKQIGSLTNWKSLPDDLGVQHTIILSN